MNKICIINGVNLSQVGHREKEIYGTYDIFDHDEELRAQFSELKLLIDYENTEGGIVDILHERAKEVQGFIINPGAFTHSSVAIADAIKATGLQCVEVHISQVFAREPYRRRSLVAQVCKASISGMGLKGYELAIQCLLD